jgi:hypothetical protein
VLIAGPAPACSVPALRIRLQLREPDRNLSIDVPDMDFARTVDRVVAARLTRQISELERGAE